ncbi:magnesium-translocating P-type ATPase [Clostridium botulinum]|uniref:Magnesium-transporting ATPase, P-type 1 n=1 Tax=Clostridium botulinum (strain Hall / ATCC 3502 / NCTC 13319 / Type A) TaxID=441771 RepID=A5I5V5_CLOBH|nr:magnesium-translocating P-type ATPase [Clostridium botulinum]ABS33638.1 magnesium-translocating P-type ATPase [Clostridium botulinum A str. ATCC 19397]ABS38802.1 magnesium-importing ATPase [Clostridium botulinum A str. Hall]AUN11868.1 magnesium-translocating P-type ATPase [Clostridium botulinum]AUN22811.1 magnesium-translocating P-type ATPase [Clostridium botulinum]AUN26560.1 magnesium-translocating P-type ATPase [Clostridium botulinum]
MINKRKVNVQSIEQENTKKLFNLSKMNLQEVYKELNTDIKGLTINEVENRIEQYGLNQVEHEKPIPWYVQLFKAFINPFILVLLVLAGVSLITDVILVAPENRSFTTVIVVGVMVTISGLLKFSEELKSNKAAEKLKQLVRTTAAVYRKESDIKEIDMSEIVPGDIVYLAAGDMIPADVRIITSKDLFVSQSSLTGESEPVEKYSILKNRNEDLSVSELDNICLLGTNIISGSATAVVISTGNDTYLGTMASTLTETKNLTSFEKGINSVSMLLIKFMFVMVPIVFFINGITKGNWLEALLFAISIAVGLTPEMLPMIVTTNLAKGAVVMAKRKTVVKKLDAIQNFGAMDVLCTDKTGTLTLDKIVVERYLNIHGEQDQRVLRHAYLNSFYQTGLRNLMDIAILEHGNEKGFKELEKNYLKVDEIPFDFVRRRMSVVLKNNEGKRQLITKGAVEEMLSACTLAEYKGEVVELTEDIKNKVLRMVTRLNNEGMRVIAIAQKNNIADENNFTVKDESNMVLMGYVGFLDPPKDSAKDAIKALNENGVAVKILTGDNDAVTLKICEEVGLKITNVLLGNEVEKMGDDKLAEIVENTNVFAKLSPLQKSRIIKILQNKGHTVGFMGDGINDAAALRQADVGISVDTAVDIAKESADIILLEKNLMVLEEGVIEGRKVFGNIIKYIKMTASSNFGNVFSVLVASMFLPFLPMLPIHLLIQNLFYDISQISIPWDTMDKEYLRKPRKWNASDIGRFMIFIGPVSSIFDIITYLVMWFVFKANTPAMQSLFQSGWFIEGLLSQTLIVHMIRTKKIPFIQSRATAPVLLLTGIIMAAGICLPFTSFGASVGLQPLPFLYFPWLIGILLAYCVLTQFIKRLYIKKFNSWL